MLNEGLDIVADREKLAKVHPFLRSLPDELEYLVEKLALLKAGRVKKICIGNNIECEKCTSLSKKLFGLGVTICVWEVDSDG